MDKLLEDIDINIDKDICNRVRNCIQFNTVKETGFKIKIQAQMALLVIPNILIG